MKMTTRKKIFIIPAGLLLAGFLSLALTKSDIYRQIAQSTRLLNNAYKYLITYYADEVNVEEFTRTILRSISDQLDPYTVYLETDERDGIELLKTGKYGGVGIQIGKREDQLTVIAPMDDSPAKRAGIISGDIITKIDSAFTKDLDIGDAAKKIRGEKGTKVILTIQRNSADDKMEFSLTREDIQVKDVAYSGVIEDNIGYIRLTRFSKNSTQEVKTALMDLLDQNVAGIVLDVRDNPGGLLQSAIDILEMLVPKGQTLLSTKGQMKDSNRTFISKNKPLISEDIAIAVLINEGSASASEIVAGTIQDLDRGIVVGRKSFGKGLVQSVYRLDEDRSLKITTAKYYIPSGRLIQKPDYVNEELIRPLSEDDTLFVTIGGREVVGGGGITPDVHVEAKTAGPLLRECWRNGLFFSFVQQEKPNYNSFDDVLSDDQLMQAFRTFIEGKELNISLSGERALNDAKEKFLSKDSTNAILNDAFTQLETYIHQEEDQLFNRENDDLQDRLLMEFADFFDGNEGRFGWSLQYDKAVIQSVGYLKDQGKYSTIFQAK